MIHRLEFTGSELLPYVNWIYFFHAWGMPPRFASIAQTHDCPACKRSWLNRFAPEEQAQAREALQLYEDATEIIRQRGHDLKAYALFGIFPAWSENDNVVVQTSDGRTMAFPFLRQQTSRHHPFLCWADFIAPPSSGAHHPRGTSMGVFATTTDAPTSPNTTDDYEQLLSQTIADRMAEAAAERMHELVRQHYWGYAPHEQWTISELFAEKYEGRRPAVGYPSIPDLSMNFLIDECIGLDKIGIRLTENGMMHPHASVSGFLFDHPASRHFAIGSIGSDQLKDYAQRRNMSIDDMKKFLAKNVVTQK